MLVAVASTALGCAGADSSQIGPENDEGDLQVSSQALTSPGFGSVAWEELTPTPAGGTLANLKASLPLLQGRDIALVLHWPSTKLADAARWDIVNDARARGIRVFPWVTLPNGSAADNLPGASNYAKTGYFPNDTNYAEWIAKAKELMAMWRARGLPPTTMSVDLEMRKNRLHQFAEMTGNGAPLDQIEALLRQGINPTRWQAARAAFKKFVDEAHAQGFKVNMTTLLPMLDDFVDDDADLRQAFGVPLENPPLTSSSIQWDEISFQVQRTLYGENFPNVTSYFVLDYGRLARLLFGARAGVGLGLTHGGISNTAPLYPNGTELRLDVQAALKAGVPSAKIGVYSFLGMYTRTPTTQWFQAPQSSTGPSLDLGTGLVHGSFWTLDGLLDD